MCNFWTLAGFEYKKVLRRKIIWITGGILIAVSIFMSLSSLLNSSVSDGEFYESVVKNTMDAKEISGRKIDDRLLVELKYSGKRIPDGLSYFFTVMLGTNDLKGLTAEKIYQARRELFKKEWKEHLLTDGEKEYLEAKEERLKVPFVYQYSDGYKKMSAMFYAIGIMQTLFIAVCLPTVFSEEHHRRTDQLILSSSQGKRTSFLAKIFVGITIAAAASLLLILAAAIPNFWIYGTDGFSAQIQLVLPGSSWMISIGEAVLILLCQSFAAGLLQSVTAMVLAERFRSSVTAMAVIMGVMILTLAFQIPEQYRVISQIWNCLPSNAAAVWGAFDNRLIKLFGGFYPQWQVIPFVYILLSAVGAMAGGRTYCKYQAGRD